MNSRPARIVRLSYALALCAAALGLHTLTPTAAAADLEPMMLTPGKLLMSDSFDGPQIDSRWAVAKGKWDIVDGALHGSELASDNHPAVIGTNIELPADVIVQFDFRFDGAKGVHLSFNGKGHICRAMIAADGFTLKGDVVKNDPNDKAATVGQVKQSYEAGKWYTMIAEIHGDEFVARVDGGPVAFGSDAKIGREKTSLRFPAMGESISIDNVKVWAGTPKADWEATRAKLPKNEIAAPAPPTAAERFGRLDADADGSVTAEEFTAKVPADRRKKTRARRSPASTRTATAS